MCLSKHWVHPKSTGELSCFPVFDCHWCGACPIPDKRIWKQLLMYILVFFSKILDNPWFSGWSVWIWWYEMTCKAELGSTMFYILCGTKWGWIPDINPAENKIPTQKKKRVPLFELLSSRVNEQSQEPGWSLNILECDDRVYVWGKSQ